MLFNVMMATGLCEFHLEKPAWTWWGDQQVVVVTLLLHQQSLAVVIAVIGCRYKHSVLIFVTSRLTTDYRRCFSSIIRIGLECFT